MSDPNRDSSPSSSFNERSPNVEALFLLQTWLSELDQLRDEITHESARSMRFIVESRAAGPATDITAILLQAKIDGKRLDEWHKSQETFGEHGAAYYRGGLLYGSEFAQMIRRRLLKHEMEATNLDAYDAALDFVEASYKLEAVRRPEKAWQRTEARGRAVTGSDLLSIMSATLHDHFSKQIASTIDSSGIDERDLEALHTGMIDATAFYWAYDAVLRGEIPHFHASPKDYIPTFDQKAHYLVPSRIRLDAEDSLRALVSAQKEAQNEDLWITIPQPFLRHIPMKIPIMLVQIGANEFCYAIDLDALCATSKVASFLRSADKSNKLTENIFEQMDRSPVITSAVGGLGLAAVASAMSAEGIDWQGSATLIGLSVIGGALIKCLKQYDQ